MSLTDTLTSSHFKQHQPKLGFNEYKEQKNRASLTDSILFILLFLSSVTPMQIVDPNLLIIGTTAFTSVVFVHRRKSINPILFIVWVLWFLINLAAYYRSVSYGLQSFPPAFYMMFVRILLAYMLVSTLGVRFLMLLEKWLFKLSLLSLPLFIGELIASPVYFRLASLLNFATWTNVRENGGWYGGFYTFDGTLSGRNCGFATEPGAFSVFLLLLIIIRFRINSVKIDKHIIVYFICLLTTFSTTGYLLGFILLLAFFVAKAKFVFPVLLIPISMIMFATQVWGLDFIGPKLLKYYDEVELTHVTRAGNMRMSRFGILVFAVEQSVDYPLGHGAFPARSSVDEFGETISGANTYAILLIKWGWIGVFMFLIGYWHSVKTLFIGYGKLQVMLFYIVLTLSITAYTLDTNILFLMLVLYPITVSARSTYIPATTTR